MASAGETEKGNSQHVRLQIRHSCVCNRQYILMSHQTEPENYSPVVYSILGNLDVEGNRKLTFPIDRFQMHVIVDNGLVFSCITYKTNHHYMPFMFLETFQRKFHEIPSLVSRSVHARENEFDRDFGPVLTTIVYEFNIGRGDKISQLQVQVDDVKRIMLDNVEKVMQRGEDLDNLLTKTESLESSGGAFRRRTREVVMRAKCKNLKMWLVIGGILGVVLTVAILLIFGVIHM
uniref:Vesicle-associated membrane protein 7 n=1 Tax=Timema bartmani TaxID=61472 RepID=A0A7R9F7F5_9NEOP|nr:unnamed protein product [Timema bartmani]